MAVNKETLLQATLNKLRNAFNIEKPGSLANRAWQSKSADVLASAQRGLQSLAKGDSLTERMFPQSPRPVREIKKFATAPLRKDYSLRGLGDIVTSTAGYGAKTLGKTFLDPAATVISRLGLSGGEDFSRGLRIAMGKEERPTFQQTLQEYPQAFKYQLGTAGTAAKIPTAVAGLTSKAGISTLAGLAGIGTAFETGINIATKEKEPLLSALRSTGEELPTLISKAGFYSVTNNLTAQVLDKLGIAGRAATKGDLLKKGTLMGMSNLMEDVITSLGLGWDKEMDFKDAARSFLLPSLFLMGDLKKVITASPEKVLQNAVDVGQAKIDASGRYRAVRNGREVWVTKEYALKLIKQVQEQSGKLASKTLETVGDLREKAGLGRYGDEGGFISFGEEIGGKIKGLSKELQESGAFEDIAKNIKEFDTSLEKATALKSVADRKASLAAQVRDIGFRAFEAHKAGNIELRNQLNSQKAKILASMDSAEKAVRAAPIKQTTKKFPTKIENKIVDTVSNLKKRYLPRSKVIDNPKLAQTSFKAAREELYGLIDSLHEYVSKKVGDEAFISMLEGKTVPSQEFTDLVAKHKTLMDSIMDFSEREMGYIEGYFPHEPVGIDLQDEVALFGDSLITRFNLSLGHTKPRLGGLDIDFSRDYSRVMKNYVDQMLYAKYGDFINTTKPEQEILLNIRSLKDTKYSGFDYIGRLNSLATEAKEVVDYKVTLARAFKKTLLPRTTNDNFSKMGDTVFTAFRKIRDSRFAMEEDQTVLKPFIENNDFESIIKYFSDKLQLSEDSANAFAEKSLELIRRRGLDAYINKVSFRVSFAQPRQNFIDTIKNVTFTDSGTKDYVNKFIERELATVKYSSDLLDKINETMALAHIGGNLKVALVQGTETGTLPIHYGIKNTYKGFVASLTDSRRLLDTYGFKDVPTDYDLSGGGRFESVLKGIPKKLKGILYKPVAIMENWKNKVFAGAAEASGLDKGLAQGSKELRDYVRDEVFKHAHIANEYNIPEVLKDSSVYRAALLYSQFSFKSFFEVTDEVAAKNYGKAAGLVITRAISAMVMAKIFGVPMKWALGGLLPGLGPILQLPGQFIGYISQAEEAGNEQRKDYYLKKAGSMIPRNLMPGGSQLYKTGGYLSDLSRGYAETPSGSMKYPVKFSPLNTSMGIMFGRGATSESKEYYRGDERPLSDNMAKYVRAAEDPKAAYKKILFGRDERKKQKDIKTELESAGIGAIKLGKEYYYLDDENNAKALKIAPRPAESDLVKYARWEDATFKKAKILNEVTTLSESDKEAIFEDIGLSREDVDYYSIASEENRIKSIHVREEAKNILSTTKDRQKMLQALIDMRREIAGKMILTSGVINDLVDEGIITYNEGKTLKKIEWDTGGKVPVAKVTGRGGGAKLKKVKFVPVDVLDIKKTKLKRLAPLKVSVGGLGAEDIGVPDIKALKLEQPKYKVKFNL